MTDPDDLEDDAECTDEDPPTTDDDTCEPEPTTTPADDDTCDPPEEDTAVEDSELPKSNTPQGSRQRLKYYAPNPESLITLGSKTGAGGQDPHGEDGVNIATEHNINMTATGHTNIYAHQRYVATCDDVIEVSGGQIARSSEDKYRLLANTGVEITAGGSAVKWKHFSALKSTSGVRHDEGDVSASIASINTENPRSLAEGAGKTMSVLWGIVKLAYAVPKLKSLYTKGVKEVFGDSNVSPLLAGAKGSVDVVKGLVDAAEGVEAVLGGLAYVAGWKSPSIDYLLPGDGSSKVKIHGEGGVALTSNASIKGVAIRSVGFTAGQKVSLAGGLSFSAKAGGSASVYGIVGSKIDSVGIVSVGSDKCQAVKVQSTRALSLESGTTALKGKDAVTVSGGRVSVDGKTQVVVHGEKCVMSGSKGAGVYGAKTATLASDADTFVWAKNKVEIMSDAGNVEIEAKTKLRAGIGDKVGLEIKPSKVSIGTQGGYALFEDRGVKLGGPKITANGKCIFG